MYKSIFRYANISLLLICMVYPAAVRADDSELTFEFNDVEIKSFIKVVSEITGRNYVIDPAVTGKINVTTPSPISRDAVETVFQSVLEVNGYAAVADGEIIRIVPAGRARQEAGMADGADTGIETQIFRLKTANPSELLSLLQPLLSRAGHISAHSPTRTIVITDFRRNLNRFKQIIHGVDSSDSGGDYQCVRLQHAVAADLAEALSRIFLPRSGQDFRAVFVPEERSNSLLIFAPAELQSDLFSMIQKLDIPLPKTQSRLRVIPLRFAEAERVASILSSHSIPMLSDQNATGSPGSDTPAPLTSGVTIMADPATNALIVTAPPEIYASLEQAVQILDVPRNQIFVESLIVEISTDKARELGVEWRLTDPLSDDSFRGIGGTNFSADGTGSALQQVAANPFDTPSGLVLGLVKGTVTFGGVEFANIGALARAMETNSDVNVLSTPHILTLDNEEAEIIVGEERPYLKSAQTTDTGATIRSYEFKDTGITMRLTPRITGNGDIQMKIFQEIKNFVAESDVGAVTSTKRQAKTTVRIPDGHTIAIGGLIKEDLADRESRVPCLGAVPFLGELFKASRKNRARTNLLIFLTPHAITNFDKLGQLTNNFRERLHVPDPDAANGFDPVDSDLFLDEEPVNAPE